MATLVNGWEGSAGSSTTASHTFSFSPTSGNILFAVISSRTNTIPSTPTGWTLADTSSDAGGIRAIVVWKESDGTETSISSTVDNDDWTVHVAEYSDVDTTTPVTTSGHAGGNSLSSVTATTDGNAGGGDGFAIGIINDTGSSHTATGWTSQNVETNGSGSGPSGGVTSTLFTKDTDFADGSAESVTVDWGGGSTRHAAMIVDINDLAGGVSAVIGQITETDSAQALAHSRALAIGQIVETDLAQALTPAKKATLGQAIETSSAQSLGWSKAATLGQPAETDTALAVSSSAATVITIAQIVETDTAQSLGHSKKATLGQITETDVAFAIISSQTSRVDLMLLLHHS